MISSLLSFDDNPRYSLLVKNKFEKIFPFYKQSGSKDCVPTCLQIIAKHYGKLISLQEIRELSETTREGNNLLKLSDAAEAIGFKSIGVKIDFHKLKEARYPVSFTGGKNHFVVVYNIKKMWPIFRIYL